MKGPVLSSFPLVPLLVLASACAATAHPPRMPAWSPAPAELVTSAALPAAAPADIDDDKMRVPREVEPEEIWPASGLYVGGALISSQPLGDFDGDVAYRTSARPTSCSCPSSTWAQASGSFSRTGGT
jgi:hypothetical protein